MPPDVRKGFAFPAPALKFLIEAPPRFPRGVASARIQKEKWIGQAKPDRTSGGIAEEG
jgi:hypothetical protein